MTDQHSTNQHSNQPLLWAIAEQTVAEPVAVWSVLHRSLGDAMAAFEANQQSVAGQDFGGVVWTQEDTDGLRWHGFCDSTDTEAHIAAVHVA